jgi:uncharacterized protein (DUF1697 family)
VARLIVLLRGINLVSRNRVSMPELRLSLAGAGFEDVRTYLQSGNVALTTDLAPASLAGAVGQVVAHRFGLDIGVVVRTPDEVARVVARNPLAGQATDPRRYQVTFLDGEPDLDALGVLEAATVEGERLVVIERELYTWHPDGVGRSKLARLLSGKSLGATATTRNWTTVTALPGLAAG